MAPTDPPESDDPPADGSASATVDDVRQIVAEALEPFQELLGREDVGDAPDPELEDDGVGDDDAVLTPQAVEKIVATQVRQALAEVNKKSAAKPKPKPKVTAPVETEPESPTSFTTKLRKALWGE